LTYVSISQQVVGDSAMKVMLVTTLLLLVSLVNIAQSCTCFETHPSKADYWIRAKVVSEVVFTGSLWPPTDENAFRNYNVEIKEVYNGKLGKQVPQDGWQLIRLTTPRSSSVCGSSLTVGEEYELSGRVKKGILTTTLCDRNELWEESEVPNAEP